jgi:hypothetical protein
MDTIIHLVCIIHQTDYWRRGRTTRTLGIDDWSVGEFTRYVIDGDLDQEAFHREEILALRQT